MLNGLHRNKSILEDSFLILEHKLSKFWLRPASTKHTNLYKSSTGTQGHDPLTVLSWSIVQEMYGRTSSQVVSYPIQDQTLNL